MYMCTHVYRVNPIHVFIYIYIYEFDDLYLYLYVSTGEAASGEQPKGNGEQPKGNMQRTCMEVTGTNRGQRDERLLQGVAVL